MGNLTTLMAVTSHSIKFCVLGYSCLFPMHLQEELSVGVKAHFTQRQDLAREGRKGTLALMRSQRTEPTPPLASSSSQAQVGTWSWMGDGGTGEVMGSWPALVTRSTDAGSTVPMEACEPRRNLSGLFIKKKEFPLRLAYTLDFPFNDMRSLPWIISVQVSL